MRSRTSASTCGAESSSGSSGATDGEEHAAEVPRRDLRADTGRIEVVGRVSPFIELGVGFNPDLTARDNVVINAIMLGLSRREAQAAVRRDHRVRRARGVRRSEAEELLLGDERAGSASRWRSRWTPTCCWSTRSWRWATPPSSASASTSSTGSAPRAHDPVRDPRHEHGRALLRPRHADRARATMLGIGDPADIAKQYNEVNFGKDSEVEKNLGTMGVSARVERTWCENSHGVPIISSGHRRHMRALHGGRVHRRGGGSDARRGPQGRGQAFSVRRRPAAASRSPVPSRRGERIIVRLIFGNWLAAGRYTLTPTLATVDPDHRVLGHRPDVGALLVESPLLTGGAVDIPTELDIERL